MPDHLQPPLFGDPHAASAASAAEPSVRLATHQPPQRLTLDALVQAARVEAAKKSDGGAVGAVVRRLAQATGGSLPVSVLLDEGFPSQALADAAQGDPDRKRSGPRARLGLVSGQPVLWLTTSGWQAAGRSTGRELSPSAESVAHATAPAAVATWLDEVTRPYAVSVDVVSGQPCRDFGERVKALAWSRVQGRGDATGAAGSLTGGLYPDALLCERWADASLYGGAWGREPETQADAAEQVLGLEVEATRKSDEPLRWKVEKWAGALGLGACHAVVWVVRSRTVADRLAALGVGHDGQLLVPAVSVGLEGEEMPGLLQGQHVWWPLRLAGTERPR